MSKAAGGELGGVVDESSSTMFGVGVVLDAVVVDNSEG
jgi:hypothetical protein